jgi:hypothetical protein
MERSAKSGELSPPVMMIAQLFVAIAGLSAHAADICGFACQDFPDMFLILKRNRRNGYIRRIVSEARCLPPRTHPRAVSAGFFVYDEYRFVYVE